MAQHQGGCQCGAVHWTAEVSLDQPVICNCSRCQPLGVVLVFTPSASFTLERGEGSLTDYRFNSEKIRHRFCKVCGVQSFSEAAMPDGTPTVAINANCIEGVDARALAAKAYLHDGRAA